MNEDEMRYCIAKQLLTVHALQTDYGDVPLDTELAAAVAAAVRAVLESRLQGK